MITLPESLPGTYIVIPSEGKVWRWSGTTGQDRYFPLTAIAASEGGTFTLSGLNGLSGSHLIGIALLAAGILAAWRSGT